MVILSLSRRKALARLGMTGLGASLALMRFPLACAQGLAAVPEIYGTNLVRAGLSSWNGRSCLAIELTDAEQARALAEPGGNPPSYAIVEQGFSDGVIEVDVAAMLTGRGGPDARGFVGLAFHIDAATGSYEAVYLRMTNGRFNVPPPPAPRIHRAIQYVAHPNFHFNVSRARFPGRYERGADIAAGGWYRLRLEIRANRLRASVNGSEALAVDDLRYSGRRGAVGLWVGDGSRGYFSRLDIATA